MMTESLDHRIQNQHRTWLQEQYTGYQDILLTRAPHRPIGSEPERLLIASDLEQVPGRGSGVGCAQLTASNTAADPEMMSLVQVATKLPSSPRLAATDHCSVPRCRRITNKRDRVTRLSCPSDPYACGSCCCASLSCGCAQTYQPVKATSACLVRSVSIDVQGLLHFFLATIV